MLKLHQFSVCKSSFFGNCPLIIDNLVHLHSYSRFFFGGEEVSKLQCYHCMAQNTVCVCKIIIAIFIAIISLGATLYILHKDSVFDTPRKCTKSPMHEYFLCPSVQSVGTGIMKNTCYFPLAQEMSGTRISLDVGMGSQHPPILPSMYMVLHPIGPFCSFTDCTNSVFLVTRLYLLPCV